MTFRLIAIPIEYLPEDTVFCIGTKRKTFVDNHFSDMCVAKLSITDKRLRPQGFEDGSYIVFADRDLIDPLGLGTTGEGNRPQTVRIVGLSRKQQSLFYKDVDVSEVPVKFMRLVEEKDKIEGPRPKQLPPVPNSLPEGDREIKEVL
jgi:hypothetical protein